MTIMDKKVKLALLALLGFSTACSTVKSGSKSKDPEKTEIEQPRTVVMYGVRPPVEKEIEIQEKPLSLSPQQTSVPETAGEGNPEAEK